jgi:hypothetical protein
MEGWVSEEQIAESFSLPRDAELLKDGLRKLLSELHPDKNGGDFRPGAAVDFHRAKSALEFLEGTRAPRSDLIRIDQLPMLLKELRGVLTDVQPRTSAVELERSYLAHVRHQTSRNLLFPRIGSGAFAAATAFLAAFPDKFEKNPVLGPLISSPSAKHCLLIATALSAYLFLCTWLSEKMTERRAKYMASSHALKRLAKSLEQRYREGQWEIGASEITELLQEKSGSARVRIINDLLVFVPRPQLDLSDIEQASDIQIQKLIDRGILTPIKRPSVDQMYDLFKVTRNPGRQD